MDPPRCHHVLGEMVATVVCTRRHPGQPLHDNGGQTKHFSATAPASTPPLALIPRLAAATTGLGAILVAATGVG